MTRRGFVLSILAAAGCLLFRPGKFARRGVLRRRPPRKRFDAERLEDPHELAG